MEDSEKKYVWVCRECGYAFSSNFNCVLSTFDYRDKPIFCPISGDECIGWKTLDESFKVDVDVD